MFERDFGASQGSNHFLQAARLFEEFVVDCFSQVESGRLTYLRFNQEKLRADQYKGLQDALDAGIYKLPSIPFHSLQYIHT